jgi:DNA-binding LytR/AlgR family response regulator
MTTALNCIIVDDEYGAIEVLEGYVSKVPWLTLSASFSDPLAALNHLSHRPTDLVFLDINMPDLGGLQLARLIQAQSTAIIFCTAYPQHALASYEVEALDYLLKPIPFERFLRAVNKLKSCLTEPVPEAEKSEPTKQLFVKSGSQIHQIEINDISVIRKDGHYIIFQLPGKELLSRMTFQELLSLLPEDKFIQVHRSYVVALEKIQIIQKQFVQVDGREIPIGDAHKDAFFQKVNYIGN